MIKTKTERLQDIFNYFVSRDDFTPDHHYLVIGGKNIRYYSNEAKDYYQVKYNNIVITVSGEIPYQLELEEGIIFDGIDFNNWLNEIEEAIKVEKSQKSIDIDTLTINGKKYKLIED